MQVIIVKSKVYEIKQGNSYKQLCGYRLYNLDTEKEVIVTVAEISNYFDAKKYKVINAVYNKKTNTVRQKRNAEIEILKEEKPKINKVAISLDVYQRDELWQYLQSCVQYKHRVIYDRVYSKYTDDTVCKVIGMIGLRRTGKTILMQQVLLNIVGEKGIDKCCWITCNESVTMSDLYAVLDKCLKQGIKYVALDEVTGIVDFTINSAKLVDKYVKFGMRIICAGTQSFSMYVVSKDKLYDRIYLIDTTFIPYKEYKVLTGTSLEQYLKIGGTLITDFDDYANCGEYISTSIIDNIVTTIEHTPKLQEQFEYMSSVKLRNYIARVIDNISGVMTECIINDVFAPNKLTTALKMYNNRVADGYKITEINEQQLEVIGETLSYLLEIRNNEIKIEDEMITKLLQYLGNIGAIYKFNDSNEYMLVQTGLAYSQCMFLLEIMKQDQNMKQLLQNGYSVSVVESIMEIIQEDVLGKVLENLIAYNLLKFLSSKRYCISKDRQKTGEEIDIVIWDKQEKFLYLLEVKHSKLCVSEQAKHLQNLEYVAKLQKQYECKEVKKGILYMGKTVTMQDIQYINAEEFLCEVSKWIC